MYGTSDTQTLAESKEFDGFTLTWSVAQTNIAADGSTVVNIYYDRNEYTITFDTWIGTEVESITARYGSWIEAPANPSRTWYQFSGWNPSFPSTMPLDWLAITAEWTANTDTAYHVRHELESLDSSTYDLIDVDDMTWTSDTLTEAVEKVYSWFTVQSYEQLNIEADGSTVVVIRYNRNSYTIVFKADDTILKSELLRFEAPVTAPLTWNIKKLWYHFSWWDVEVPETMPSNDLTINVVWERNGWSWWGGIRIREAEDDSNEQEDETQEHGSADEEWSELFEQYRMIEHEVLSSYAWAYKYGITTMDTVEWADPEWPVLRWHMAKMVVNYAVNVLWREMPTEIPSQCTRWDKESAWESEEIKDYAKKACALWVMGIYMEDFLPNKEVSRAEFWTILSRLLWWDIFNVIDSDEHPYYEKHLIALKDNEIMMQIDRPLERKELREWIWVMLRRSQWLVE